MGKACWALVVVLVLSPLARGAGPTKNIVVMIVDDQGLDAGCYGNPDVRTPNLDRLAAEGTRFNYAFCTTASCSPSRSVVLTGLYNHASGQYGLAHDVHQFHTRAGLRTLPVLLKEAGYRTCAIGKIHVEPAELYRFDVYPHDGLDGGFRSSVQMAERAEQFIRGPDDRPFFVYLAPTDPHRSFGNEREYPGVTPVTYDPQQLHVPSWLPDTAEVRRELAQYYQSISRVDQGLGRLMQALSDTGHADDTLLIYLSDNGAPFPGAKTTLYEPGIHLPLVVRLPGQARRGAVCDALVTWADLTPTVLEYAGVKPPKGYALHGRSFLSVLGETDPPGRDEIYGSHTFHEVTMYYPMRMVRTRKYKYILNLAHPLPFPFASDLYGSATWQGVLQRQDAVFGRRAVSAYVNRPRHELYDLEADPHEVHNLADSPPHLPVLSELQGRLRRWQEQTKDPWLIKYRHE